jgi:hypothetical protein
MYPTISQDAMRHRNEGVMLTLIPLKVVFEVGLRLIPEQSDLLR